MGHEVKYVLSGDILHPGFVSVEANSLAEALETAEDNFEFNVEDESSGRGELAFKFDGTAWTEDSDGNQTEVTE